MIDRLIALLYVVRNKILLSLPMRKFRRNFPGSSAFLLERFSILKFTGLPLTALAVSLILNLVVLSEFTEEVMNSSTFTLIDSSVAHFLFSIRTPVIAKALYMFTFSGHVYTIVTLASLLILLFLWKKRKWYSLAILISVVGSGATILAGKNIYRVNRPTELSWYPETSFSFPSGHATIAMAFYGLLCYLLVREQKSMRSRSLVFFTGFFFIFLLGFSRIYLCVHYLSDVAGGYLLGMAWLILGITFVEWKERS